MKRIVIDLDSTLTLDSDLDYEDKMLNQLVADRCHEYKRKGFEIIIYTARNMRTYHGDQGKITAKTLPIIINWLDKNNVPYDEIYIGKPWCGNEGFYVDDKAIRPSEFTSLSYEELSKLLDNEKETSE